MIKSLIKFSKNKPLTFTLTSCTAIGFTGDLICQKLEHKLFNADKKSKWTINWDRTSSLTISSTILTFPLYYWYNFLDSKFPGKSLRMVSKKALIDYFIACAPYFCLFYLSLEVYNYFFIDPEIPDKQRDLKTSFTNWKTICQEKLPALMIVDFFLWIPFQFANFRFIPSRHRVVGTKVAELFFMILLSFISFNNIDYEGMANRMLGK